MKKKTPAGWPWRYCAVLICLLVLNPAHLNAVDNPSAARFKVSTEPISEVSGEKRVTPELGQYTVEAIRKRLPKRHTGRMAKSVPIKLLSFISKTNYIAMEKLWDKIGNDNPHVIVIGQGSYSLEKIHQQIDDPGVIKKEGKGVYTLFQPLYVAPTASLVISEGNTLRLSLQHGVFILSNSEFFVVDSKITVWDVSQNNQGQREKLSEQELLLKGIQKARPYILALNGSHLYFANSEFFGLGYQGSSGTYGLSLGSQAQSRDGLRGYLRTLPKAGGWFVGNTFEDLFFGFFTSDAQNVVLAGNLFRDNIIYNIDPHDDTKNLIIARNVTYGAKKAHGIILSREVNDSFIVDNITFNNKGSGIMLDRSCMNTVISNNLVFSNEGDGIAVFESDDNQISGNNVMRNGRNGIYIRNSLEINLVRNQIEHNGQYGLEVSAVNIDFLETRDFLLDPYHQRASASLVQNAFVANLNSAILTKDAEKLTLINNTYQDSGPSYFAGDLESHAISMLENELEQDRKVHFSLRRPPGSKKDKSQHPHRRRLLFRAESIEILHQLAEEGNAEAMYHLGRYYQGKDAFSWYSRAIAFKNPDAMYALGLNMLSEQKHTEEERFEGLVLVSMAEWGEHIRAHGTLVLAPYLWRFTSEEVMSARKQAFLRIKNGQYWNTTLWPNAPIKSKNATLSNRKFQDHFDRIAIQAQNSEVDEVLFELLNGYRKKVTRYDFVSEEIRKLKAEIKRTSNQKKRLRNQRIERQRIQDREATGLRRAFLDRQKEKDKAAKVLLKTISPKEQKALVSRIQKKLELVNQHRAPESRLEVKHLPLFSD